jgi:hypothetical protein
MVSNEKLQGNIPNNKVRLALLALMLAITAVPIAKLLFFTNNSQLYINSLLRGSAFISINTKMSFLEIVSKTLTIVPLRITFFELGVYLTSVVVFCLSLILTARVFYNAKTKSCPTSSQYQSTSGAEQ